MNVRSWRKIHRYLGFIIGIQLLLWTTSGLVFSWNSISHVRGEHLVRSASPVDLRTFQIKNVGEIPGSKYLKELGDNPVNLITLRAMLDQPVYELSLGGSGVPGFVLIDAVTGIRLSPIDESTAGQIALADFADEATIRSAELIESAGPHSEYRGKELPAYRVVLEHPSDSVIYVSANRGVVTTRRNNQWRLFDFFWMLHTMDYQGRDNFNSWLLRGMSVFGVITVLSGFGLGLVTTGWIRKIGRKPKRPRSTQQKNKDSS